MKPRRVAGGNFSFRLKGFVLNIFLDQEWLHQISSSGLKPDSAWLPNTATQECQLNLNFNLTSIGWISCENCQGLLQFLDQGGSGSWPPALPAKFVHACRAVCYSFPSLHSFADVVTAAIVVQVFTSIYKDLQDFTSIYTCLQVFTSSEGDDIFRVERSPRSSVSFSVVHLFHQTCQAKRPTK